MSNLKNIAKQVEEWLEHEAMELCPFSPEFFGRGCWHDNQGFLRWHYSEVNYLACCLATGCYPLSGEIPNDTSCPCAVIGEDETIVRARAFVARHGKDVD